MEGISTVAAGLEPHSNVPYKAQCRQPPHLGLSFLFDHLICLPYETNASGSLGLMEP